MQFYFGVEAAKLKLEEKSIYEHFYEGGTTIANCYTSNKHFSNCGLYRPKNTLNIT